MSSLRTGNASDSDTAWGGWVCGISSWARLIAKVFHADPLTCRKCGGKLKIVAYLHDQVAIKQILDHLGLSPPEDPSPPPALHYVVRVPVDEEGREIAAP